MIFKKKPSNTNFSSGPTRKPEGWDLNKLEKRYLGRYHRSEDVKEYPTFTYNVGTGAKTCIATSGEPAENRGCKNSVW